MVSATTASASRYVSNKSFRCQPVESFQSIQSCPDDFVDSCLPPYLPVCHPVCKKAAYLKRKELRIDSAYRLCRFNLSACIHTLSIRDKSDVVTLNKRVDSVDSAFRLRHSVDSVFLPIDSPLSFSFRFRFVFVFLFV